MPRIFVVDLDLVALGSFEKMASLEAAQQHRIDEGFHRWLLLDDTGSYESSEGRIRPLDDQDPVWQHEVLSELLRGNVAPKESTFFLGLEVPRYRALNLATRRDIAADQWKKTIRQDAVIAATDGRLFAKGELLSHVYDEVRDAESASSLWMVNDPPVEGNELADWRVVPGAVAVDEGMRWKYTGGELERASLLGAEHGAAIGEQDTDICRILQNDFFIHPNSSHYKQLAHWLGRSTTGDEEKAYRTGFVTARRRRLEERHASLGSTHRCESKP